MDAARAAAEALSRAIAAIDWSAPETRDAHGATYAVPLPARSVPFSIRTVASLDRFTVDRLREIAAGAEGRDVQAPAERAAPAVATGRERVRGTSSSTSVDSYGTEMTFETLQSMAAQMTAGIPYLPRHNYGMFGPSVEWDEVIGRTVGAEVVAVPEVVNAFDPAAPQFVLRTDIDLYVEEEKAQALLRRVDRGEPIGQSIGGWFTALRVVQNEEGETIRVMVTGVELDHLAVTRAPANPDSNGVGRSYLDAVRTAVAQARTPVVSIARSDDAAAPSGQTTETETQTHERIEAACARAERADGRVTISFDADATDDAIRAALDGARSGSLGPDLARVLELASPQTPPVDADPPREYADPVQGPPGSDAPGSALPTTARTTPETDMNPEQFRALLDAALAPLGARLEALEGRASAPAAPTSAQAQAPAPAEDWKVRAERAEAALTSVVRGDRVAFGVGFVPASTGASEIRNSSDLIELARKDAPVLSAVAAEIRTKVFDAEANLDDDEAAVKVNSKKLERALGMLVAAGIEDGLIAVPEARAAAAWSR